MNDHVGRERGNKVNQTGVSHSRSFSPGVFIPSHESHCCVWPGPPARTTLVMWRIRKARYQTPVQSCRSSRLLMMNWLLDWAHRNFRSQLFLGSRPPAPAANSAFLSVYRYDGSSSCLWPAWRPFFSPSFFCFFWSFHTSRHFLSYFTLISLCIFLTGNLNIMRWLKKCKRHSISLFNPKHLGLGAHLSGWECQCYIGHYYTNYIMFIIYYYIWS